MFKIGQKKAQAAIELAVFGAILIFLIGAIVRTAVGNSYTQDQNYQAMRMAMLASWQGSTASPASTAYNNASVLFVEDRLSPDFNKYGDLDRNAYISMGSGSFTYQMLYPLTSQADIKRSLPIMDVYINGQHFPFTTASYVNDRPLCFPGQCGTPACGSQPSMPPAIVQSECLSGPLPQGCQTQDCQDQYCSAQAQAQCIQNQCLRNQREWIVPENVQLSSFQTPAVAPITLIGTTSDQRTAQMDDNACQIFFMLSEANIIPSGTISSPTSCPSTAKITAGVTLPPAETSPGVAGGTQYPEWNAFVNNTLANGGFNGYEATFSQNGTSNNITFLNAILGILNGANKQYKLLYTLLANPGGSAVSSTFTTTVPTCGTHPCYEKELSSDLQMKDANGNTFINTYGEAAYDLLRLGYYTSAPPGCAPATSPLCQSVDAQFPTDKSVSPATPCNNCARNYIAWQWAASAGTNARDIGLNTSENQYPLYDIDGRLKEVTVYWIGQDANNIAHVHYEDPEGGDIDQTWDSNSCGPKPGLQPQTQVITFTQQGTYLLIKEGKAYDPETGQVVRSANKRDTVDLIQRTVQLSNNTGRFCSIPSGTATPIVPLCSGNDCAEPNPVEICVDGNTCNCFVGNNSSNVGICGVTVAQTCYDLSDNRLFVRSRLQDQRGRFWMTNASGQLKVQ